MNWIFLAGLVRCDRVMTCVLALGAGGMVGGTGQLHGAVAWPGFRGRGGSGVAVDGDFPAHFGPSSNVLWKVALAPGNSSPCIWEERIFLTGYAEGRLETICVDRASGKILWTRSMPPGKLEPGSHLSSPASSTPVVREGRVYSYFGAFGLVCHDFDGQERWRKPLSTPITQHGASTSPVLAGDRLILLCDQDVGSYIMAVNRETGETMWKTERTGFRRGFSTPLAWPLEEPEVVVTTGTLRLMAYSVTDGTEQWRVAGLPNEMVSSPAAGAGLVFAAGWTYGAGVSKLPTFASLLEQGDQDKDGKLSRQEAPSGPAQAQFQYMDADKDGVITRREWDSLAEIFEQSQNALLAVRPGGEGDVTRTHVAWKATRGLPYVPSPLCYDGRLYLVRNGGLISCFDAATGRVHYQEERLGVLGDYYASPVAANGKIAVASQRGVIVVWRAGDTLEVLARNDLAEQVLATPAIVGNRLYVRTAGHLYVFGESGI